MNIDFDDISLFFFLVLASIEKICPTFNTVFGHISKYLEFQLSPLGVWKCNQINKLTSVFYASVLLLIMNLVITLSK